MLIALGMSIAAVDGALWRARPARSVKAVRLHPSRVVADAFMEVLCRQPTDSETIDWDTRPVDPASLVTTLSATPEARRVREIRALYFERLRRQPAGADCPQIHDWSARGVDVDRMTRALDASAEGQRVAHVSAAIAEVTGWDPRGWDEAGLRRWVNSPFTTAEIRSRLRASRPLVAVHYFAWYQPSLEGWRNDLTIVPSDSQHPTIGQYDSGDTAVVDTQITQMEDAGFDFVIVHVIANSERTWRNAHLFFNELSGHRIKAAIILDALYNANAAAKAMWTTKAIAEFARDEHYFHLHGEPLVMLFSARIDFDVPGVVLRDVYWTDRYDPGRNTFNPSSQLDLHDWAFWASTPQPAVNGVVPVIPGYTDASLGRARTMIHSRANGRFYRGQWQRALALHPELILVYSWNEYFEQTAIEPTDAWGSQYLQMTACFIAHAHRGTTGSC
jgi:hypothetical protein